MMHSIHMKKFIYLCLQCHCSTATKTTLTINLCESHLCMCKLEFEVLFIRFFVVVAYFAFFSLQFVFFFFSINRVCLLFIFIHTFCHWLFSTFNECLLLSYPFTNACDMNIERNINFNRYTFSILTQSFINVITYDLLVQYLANISSTSKFKVFLLFWECNISRYFEVSVIKEKIM